eukprot:TRINITY_DN12048_c0_g1_i2.p2 TRINITY_DN12048_c0_g1~~TRINITY_DN12048_c0_g1_i2.p2  ORF type:complete len:105 (+),score=3.76 TRINITY_DN12048_c0_g1_i2:1231-1545(+)
MCQKCFGLLCCTNVCYLAVMVQWPAFPPWNATETRKLTEISQVFNTWAVTVHKLAENHDLKTALVERLVVSQLGETVSSRVIESLHVPGARCRTAPRVVRVAWN